LLIVQELQTNAILSCLLECSESTLIGASRSNFQNASHCCDRFYRHRYGHENGSNDSVRCTTIEFYKYVGELVLDLIVAHGVEIDWDAICLVLLRNPCTNSSQFK